MASVTESQVVKDSSPDSEGSSRDYNPKSETPSPPPRPVSSLPPTPSRPTVNRRMPPPPPLPAPTRQPEPEPRSTVVKPAPRTSTKQRYRVSDLETKSTLGNRLIDLLWLSPLRSLWSIGPEQSSSTVSDPWLEPWHFLWMEFRFFQERSCWLMYCSRFPWLAIFLREWVVSPLHNPQPGGPEYMFSLAPHPRPVRQY